MWCVCDVSLQLNNFYARYTTCCGKTHTSWLRTLGDIHVLRVSLTHSRQGEVDLLFWCHPAWDLRRVSRGLMWMHLKPIEAVQQQKTTTKTSRRQNRVSSSLLRTQCDALSMTWHVNKLFSRVMQYFFMHYLLESLSFNLSLAYCITFNACNGNFVLLFFRKFCQQNKSHSTCSEGQLN